MVSLGESPHRNSPQTEIPKPTERADQRARFWLVTQDVL